jgi:hypothetical protein
VLSYCPDACALPLMGCRSAMGFPLADAPSGVTMVFCKVTIFQLPSSLCKTMVGRALICGGSPCVMLSAVPAGMIFG